MLRGRVESGGSVLLVTKAEAGWSDDSGRLVDLGGARVLPPSEPTKIVCVGRNYALHAKELGNEVPERPLLFLKPPSAVLAHGDTILLPPDSSRVEYEGEIAVVMGRRCFDLLDAEDPMEFVAGFAPLNDVTARDLQRLDVQFTRAKSFDTFCPFGPWMVSDVDWRELTVVTRRNGEVVQRGAVRDMVFPIPDLLRTISRVMTLFPGDVVATGTPAGVGPLLPGDCICVEVAGVTLENGVSPRPARGASGY